jgi:hypothetical protein
MSAGDEISKSMGVSRQKFLDAIEGLSDKALQEPGVVGDWSVKDILIHINLWEAEMIKLLFQVRKGQRPDHADITAADVDRINAEWQQENRLRPLDQVMADFHDVRKQTLRQLENFSDEELSQPGRFPGLGENPLKEWIAGDSYVHETEHADQVLAWRKQRGL